VSQSSRQLAGEVANLLERLLVAAGQPDRTNASDAWRLRRLISFVERMDTQHRLRLEAALHLLGPQLDRQGSLQG
jgi:hypothetical protein